MNPLLLSSLLSIVTEAIKAAPSLVAEFNAIKAAGSATPEDLASLKAQIEAMDAARVASWAEADDALTKAGG